MRRAWLASAVLAVVLAVSVGPSTAAAFLPAVGPYVHVWRVESEASVGGQAAIKATTDNAVSLRVVSGGYAGRIAYGDRLAVGEQSAPFVQVSRIDLALTGGPGLGGAGAAGSFEGTATLAEYTGVDAAAANQGRLPAKPGSQVKYRVVGQWDAQLSGASASGRLLYRAVSVLSRAGAAHVRTADWFNRLGAAAPGESQQFSTQVEGIALGSSPSGAGAGGAGGASAPGVLDYVSRGLAGAPGAPAMPVPSESGAQAKDLRDAQPAGAVAIPANAVSIDLDVPSAVLDAKNRAAGLGGTWIAPLAGAWAGARSANTASTDFGIAPLLGEMSSIPGGTELAAQLGAASKQTTIGADVLRTWAAAVRAVGGGSWERSVLAETARATHAVTDSRIRPGTPAASGVLAAADSPLAPRDFTTVAMFARVPSRDTTGDAPPLHVSNDLHLIPGPGMALLSWEAAGQKQVASARRWLAYRRADGVFFWVPDLTPTVAITDSSPRGWGFDSRATLLVDAARVGRVLGVYPVPSVYAGP